MNGLTFLVIMGMGFMGGWCAYALLRGGQQTLPGEVRRRMDKWDDR